MGFERMPFPGRISTHRTGRDPVRERSASDTFLASRAIVAVLALLFVNSCAVPVAPTGGPADDTPPRLVASTPANGSTGFTGRTLELTFSEHVDRQSFPGAVSLQPEPGGRLTFDWSGKSVEITMPEDPRSETTYILSIDNSLRDARNVALDRPITLAFATGETIDAGRISGRVVRAHDGAPGAGIDIHAYATPDSALFLDRPLYRTQTGRDGTFAFSYLRETEYFVVGIRDRNGNRRLDTGEDVALPPVSSIGADTVATSPDRPDSTGFVWILDRYDDVPPAIDRVTSVGRNHIELRFSEQVRLLSTAAPDLVLSNASDASVPIRGLYVTEPILTRNVGLYTDDLTPGTYTISGRFPVADSTGNAAAVEQFAVEIPDSTDQRRPTVVSLLPDSTAGVRFRSMIDSNPTAVNAAPQGAGAPRTSARVRLWPRDSAGVRFDIPAANAVADGLITARDSSQREITDRFRLSDPVTWVFNDTSFSAPFELIMAPEATPSDSSISIVFVRAEQSDTGELSGTVVTGPAPGRAPPRIVVEVYRADGAEPARGSRSTAGRSRELPLRTVHALDGSFVIPGLPDGLRVRLRAFIDINNNGTWDAGQAVPFIPPEPVTWIDATEPVRARWETALSDTLYLHVPE